MQSSEIRNKYLEFFKSRGHVEIKPSPLVLENDPSTLFTSAGMQQLVPYLKGESHTEGKRLVDAQPCFRSQDIEEVGNNRHTTLFEMLGNWSLGDYFKKEQLTWIWEFYTKELGIPKERLYVTVFEGNEFVPKDTESLEIWKNLGVSESNISFYGVKKNWWSPSGTPDVMKPGEIGGPDSEVFFEFSHIEHNPSYGEKCHPNCDCGHFLEIGNSVFIQYQKNEDGTLSELPNKNVDYGGGIERLLMVTSDDPDVFNSDVFKPVVLGVEEVTGKSYLEAKNQVPIRIISDHLKASVFLINDGVVPSNKMQGYLLRRLLRRVAVKLYQLKDSTPAKPEEVLQIMDKVIEIYKDIYFQDTSLPALLKEVVTQELIKFNKSISTGLKMIEGLTELSGKVAFDLYQTYGFPLELTEELAIQKGLEIDKKQFEEEFAKHRDLSRTASAGMFKGGLSEQTEQTTKMHTATHLLHQALRTVLGDSVFQKGSNITEERLRFDFSYPDKLTDDQIKQVEELVNQKIKEGLLVQKQEMGLEEAKSSGAIGLFGEKYGEKVSVYTIGNFSKELCGGPHVSNTSEIGEFKIVKEEAVAAGTRRIKATLT